MKNRIKLFTLFAFTLGTVGLVLADPTPHGDINQHAAATNPITQQSAAPTLNLLEVVSNPPSLGEHALAYDPQQAVAILYGGNQTGQPYEDGLWQWASGTWQAVTAPATQPTARYGAGLGVINDALLLFGGSGANDTPLNETWQYSNNSWLQLQPALSPAARTYPAVAGAADALYLFGGNDGSTYQQDLWHYSSNGNWLCLDCAVTTRPAARTLAALAVDSVGQQLWLFGGQDAAGQSTSGLVAIRFDHAAMANPHPDNGTIRSLGAQLNVCAESTSVVAYRWYAG